MISVGAGRELDRITVVIVALGQSDGGMTVILLLKPGSRRAGKPGAGSTRVATNQLVRLLRNDLEAYGIGPSGPRRV